MKDHATNLNASYVSEINIEESVGFYGVYVRDWIITNFFL